MMGSIVSTLTPTGDIPSDTLRAENYAKTVGMDPANTKMAVVMATQGHDAAGKAMISEFTSKDGNFDYCAMRARYG